MKPQLSEQTFPCFMVEDGQRWIGYYRKSESVQTIVKTLRNPVVTEINPPERIACEDDPGVAQAAR